jgi:hypothetical protein
MKFADESSNSAADVVLTDMVEVGWRASADDVETWVEFPEDTRSLLAFAQWRDGETIRSVLARVAAAYLGRLEPAPSREGAQATMRRVRISSCELRELLSSVAAHSVR